MMKDVRPFAELIILLKISVPLIVANSIFIFQELIDAIMLGNYSPISLAAVTLAASYLFIIFLPVSGIYYAIVSQIAEARGIFDNSKLNVYQCNALLLSLVFSVLIFPLLIYSDFIFDCLMYQI